MSKKCARCEKTVYPLEELKCLDKVWHKLCFKCQECGMSLNMRNYKGFNKLPYCEAHIPKPKATTVDETPELKRIAENTKIQSNIKYHADFEKARGKYTSVADDPETLRIRQHSKVISNVTYHGDLEKKADMEQKRQLVNANGDPVDTGSQLPQQISRPQQQPPPKQVLPPQQRTVSPSKVPYDTGHMTSQGQSPYSSSRQSASTIIYTSQQGPVQQPTGDRHIGSIVDYDPLNNQYGSVATPYQGYTHPQTEHYPRGGGPPRGNPYAQSASYHGPPPQQPPHHHQPGHAYMQSRSPPKQSPGQSYGRCYRAMYDYSAGDADEVSFMDGDLIINCQQIDEGWMTGTVQRTGECGMLPANYVEPVN